jgi:hypothetical protein
MSEPENYSNPGRADRRDEPGGTSWAIILVFACIALGFTASAADYERIVANQERDQAGLVATECSVAEGKLEDIGKFLADPHTRLISLSGTGGFATEPAAIAWNSIEQNGYFLCDTLPAQDAGRGYELWALNGMGEPVKVADWDAKPGASVFPFKVEQPFEAKTRLEITAGPRSADKSPAFAGEIE